MSSPNRDTIFVETARIIDRRAYPGQQYILRLASPSCARHAQPGQFVHLRCHDSIPMRRPLSIQRADPEAGWIEVLFKTVGEGLRALSQREPGDSVDLLGPVGRGFEPVAAPVIPVLIGGGVGIPPLLFLTERLIDRQGPRPVVFFGSELPFPFDTAPSELPLPGVPADATHSLALLERWSVPARLASGAALPGCHNGFVTDLATAWLDGLPAAERARCMIHACGPEAMLRAAQRVASRYKLRSRLCLEEFMACAVGGCAGCVVKITTDEGVAMKRVCVDGPVFDGHTVYPGL